MLRALLAPLRSGLTYRRAVHLLLGAVILLLHPALGWLFRTSVVDGGLDPVALALLLAAAVVVAVAVLLVPGVRALSVTAARLLLGVALPDPDAATERRVGPRCRVAAWLVHDMLVGGVLALAALLALPSAIGFLLAPWRPFPPLPAGPAAAWTPKRARPAEIVGAVRTVAEGESLLFPAAVREPVAASGPHRGSDGGALHRAGLTLRDEEILRLVARGLSNAEIARELTLGVETVKTHVGTMLAKLHARDRTQAVVAAYESGFIDPRA